MLNLLKVIKVIRLDKWNYTFEHYKEVEAKNGKKTDWVRVGGYYSTLPSCLKAVKDYVIDYSIERNDFNVEELKTQIEALNGAYVRCELKEGIGNE